MKIELAFFAMSLLFVGCSSPGRIVEETKTNTVEKLSAHNFDRPR
jgi:PBP1b-binding outer membrane lipoprotein LpoB